MTVDTTEESGRHSQGPRTRWGDKPYYSLDYYLRQTFGEKVYKLALDGGMTCPNRDGTLGTEGCIFCSAGGSGDFAEPLRRAERTLLGDPLPLPAPGAVTEQIEAAKARVSRKIKSGRYVAYFQSYTNTYAPLPYLRALFTEAASHPEIAALSVGTRPDCLPDGTVALLRELNRAKPVWVELGLQTIHESTARAVGRGYHLPCFLDAVGRLKQAGLTVIVHVILGLPGESREQMLSTVRFLGQMSPRADGVKLQLLHILKGTKLAALHEAAPFPVLTLEDYLSLILDCVRLLPPDLVIHRLSGDGPKSLLLEPAWSGNKRLVLNSLSRAFRESGAFQGQWFGKPLP